MPTPNNKSLPPHEAPSTPSRVAISTTAAGTGVSTPSASAKSTSLDSNASLSIKIELPFGIRHSER